VKAAVVGALKGQGGAELEALGGQTMRQPIASKGPESLTGIDFGGVLREAARGASSGLTLAHIGSGGAFRSVADIGCG
jgi:hypothetical protein